MPYQLKGRKVLITGGSRGLGAVIARKFAEEGCDVAINYVNSEAPAQKLAEDLRSQHSVKTIVIQGDGGVMEDVRKCVQTTVKEFGGLDIVIGNAGWTKFADFSDLDGLDYDEWDKCWNTNVKGMHQLFKESLPILNGNPEGGVFILTSSIAGVGTSGSSMAYSVTKAAQIQLMRCLASSQGSKVRINAVLPGLLLTEWGNLYGEEKIAAIKNAASLKKVTDLEDCADAYIMLAKNTSLTGQTIQVDAGVRIVHY